MCGIERTDDAMEIKKTVTQLCLAVFLFWGLAVYIGAIGTGTSSNWPSEEKKPASETAMPLYDKGVQADKSGDNKAALNYFQQALKKDKNNPDILNMLAHSQRKLGMLNEAIDNYWKALKLRPRFPEAREYMGEAYIQAAIKEIDTLRGYGNDGEKEKAQLIKAFKDAAANLEP